MTKQIEDFVLQEKHKGSQANVFFSFEYKETVNYKDMVCNGFFVSNYNHNKALMPFLSIAVKKDIKKWLPIFVHLTCKMDQWLEKSDLWLESNSYQVLNDWLQGKDFPHEDIQALIKKIILLQVDCEKRSIEKIKQNYLPIDTGTYAQRANAYIYFYQYMLKNRTWYKTAPYEISEILYYMPKEILSVDSYFYELSEAREKLFDKCLESNDIEKNKLAIK